MVFICEIKELIGLNGVRSATSTNLRTVTNGKSRGVQLVDEIFDFSQDQKQGGTTPF